MSKYTNLKLECTAIGSLPHKDVNQATELIKKDFSTIPFWPQLVKISKKEDMIIQFLDRMPSFSESNGKIALNINSENFCQEMEDFFIDYEEIILDPNSSTIEKYAIKNSIGFSGYLNTIKLTAPKYAKGQIVGPFTLATSLSTTDDNTAIYDDTLREIIVKTLTLKALWQIYKIKQANADTIPIIFLDEPSLSQLGSSAYVGIDSSEIILMLNEICEHIKQAGGISAIHCCGKCDWTIPLKSGVQIINPDAYSFSQHFSLFAEEINEFLKNNGKIAWGIVPTLDKQALERITIQELIDKFETSVNYLTQKGINEKLIIDNSLITPSCGAGILNVALAEKAMDLTNLLSLKLKEKFNSDN